MRIFLEFEKPVAELEAKIEELRRMVGDDSISVADEVAKLTEKADRQLKAVRADPDSRGKVCTAGLWGLSRHPNYFFEWLGWVAYPVIAISLAGDWSLGWLSLIGPVLMYWLLVHVSGIPPLEVHMLKSRGEAFKRYMARTSAFFPLPPRNK